VPRRVHAAQASGSPRARNGWSPGGAAGPGGNQSADDLHVKVSPG